MPRKWSDCRVALDRAVTIAGQAGLCSKVPQFRGGKIKTAHIPNALITIEIMEFNFCREEPDRIESR